MVYSNTMGMPSLKILFRCFS